MPVLEPKWKFVSLTPYRRALSHPGVRALLLLALIARIPITAAPVVLTLHVVLDLHRGFAQSGLLGTAFAIGAAIGAPLLGRGIDRVGLRPVLILTTVVESAFWLTADHLGYEALLLAALVAGLLSIPIFSVTRQALAALVPPRERQAGFSLDSMSVEMSFAIGPALGIVALTSAGSGPTLFGAAVLIAASGVALTVLDPPVHGEEGADPVRHAGEQVRSSVAVVPLREWLSPAVCAVLLATFATVFTVAGTDTALTAVMRSFGEIRLLGLVFAIWCLASLVGGFVYGGRGSRVDPMVMLALLAVLCVPVALAGTWWLLALLVIPTGLFCAPLITATAEELTRITPASVRGQVMGVHGSALTIGNAVGAPLIGLVVDHAVPQLGFVAIGALGSVLAALGLVLTRRHHGGTPGATAGSGLVDARQLGVDDEVVGEVVLARVVRA
jgi:MFS family permease